MNPFIDFTTMTTEELLEKNKEYTKQLYKMNGQSPLYQYILDLRQQLELEYNERMYVQGVKSKQGEEVIDIGDINSDVFTPDYDDYETKIIKQVAQSYTDKGDNDE